MHVINLLPTGGRLQGEEVSSEHFGANYLFTKGASQTLGENGGFDEAAQHLNVAHLRYPGGTITEQYFDLGNPNSDTGRDSNVPVTPMDDFLAGAQEIGARVTLVLPQAVYREAILGDDADAKAAAEAEIKTFITNLMQGEYGHLIEALELGNEWYNDVAFGSDPGDALADGLVANQMAKWVQQALDADGQPFDPLIAVQIGRGNNPEENLEILECFCPGGQAAIDAVILHTYRYNPWSGNNRDKTEDQYDRIAEWEAALDRELTVIISEWNTTGPIAPELEAAAILELFNQNLRAGADLMHIWPLIQQPGADLEYRLGLVDGIDPNNPNGDVNLRPVGEIFRQMSGTLQGTTALNINSDRYLDGDGGRDALVHAYEETGERMVVFISSLKSTGFTQTFDLSAFGSLVTGYDHLWVKSTTVFDHPDVTGDALPLVTVQTAADIEVGTEADGIIELSFDPYEVIMLEFTSIANGVGVAIDGHDQTDQDDIILGSEGSDVLRGFGGDDTIGGLAGDDIIVGGAGDDVLTGGAGADTFRFDDMTSARDRVTDFDVDIDSLQIDFGSDGSFSDVAWGADHSSISVSETTIDGQTLLMLTINGQEIVFDGFTETDWFYNVLEGTSGGDNLDGGARDDLISGFEGNDLIRGYAGNDKMLGGKGNDKIRGDGGDDEIFGNEHHDTLYGHSGNDTLFGGSGNDIILGGSGNDVLTGGTGNDQISGGTGEDVFVFSDLMDDDVITDFSVGEDKIDLSAYIGRVDHVRLYAVGEGKSGADLVVDSIGNIGHSGSDCFSILAEQIGDDTHLTITQYASVITGGGLVTEFDVQITLEDVNANILSLDDFIL